MKVAVAIDSFKGSLSTFQAGEATMQGIKRVYPNAEVCICPLADGGEGTVSAIVAATGGTLYEVNALDPLARTRICEYGVIPQTDTAVVEISAAAGITLIDEKEKNPLHTTTYGVGQILADAIKKGCRKFIIGLGGSVTNDGGVGMLQALGFEFLDGDGNEIPLGGKGLEKLAQIKTENALPELKNCEFLVACDVKNPLCGANGCSAVYGPQKGATKEMIEKMDGWLENYARLTKTVNENSNAEAAGAGAAGGLGFAFLAFLNGKLQSGIELVMSATGLEEKLKNVDVVVTGEGRLDGQSCMGKAPVGVAKTAKKYGKPVLAFSGCVTTDARLCNEHGIDAFFPIVRTPCALQEAMDVKNAFNNLADTAEQAFRLIKTAALL